MPKASSTNMIASQIQTKLAESWLMALTMGTRVVQGWMSRRGAAPRRAVTKVGSRFISLRSKLTPVMASAGRPSIFWPVARPVKTSLVSLSGLEEKMPTTMKPRSANVPSAPWLITTTRRPRAVCSRAASLRPSSRPASAPPLR